MPEIPFPSFAELDRLRNHLSVLAEKHVTTLAYYYDEKLPGFHHKHERPPRQTIPISSTSTCILSLIRAGEWHGGHKPWNGNAGGIVAGLLLAPEWASSGLPANNPFTVAFLLEAVTALKPYVDNVGEDEIKKERQAHQILLDSLTRTANDDLKQDNHGSVSLLGYPPSAYLTQLVCRVLKFNDLLDTHTSRTVATWAWREIDHQLALFTAKSKNADVFQLIYSVMLAAQIGNLEEATPDQNLVLKAALYKFFEQQLDEDGTWPRSRPLFHYAGVGNAYCFEYEMLAQLLQTPNLRDRLLVYLPKLSRAAFALESTSYPIGKDGLGWSSSHHPQFHGPESWSTASVYHFIHGLGRLVAEAIRSAVFNDLGVPYLAPAAPKINYSEFAPDLLDCAIDRKTTEPMQPDSLKHTLYYHFVKPIADEAATVEAGASMSRDTPTSAIFFGPPGTSKTALADEIAAFLRWPKLTVDPSYFVREGMDRMQAQAEKLFNMLTSSERIVVLLDEFDEMVRDRTSSNEVLSRFLTTSMLPKLAKVNRSRRIVFIVATNHIENFDLAITRSGRFDLIVAVMPPKLEEKMRKWPQLDQKLRQVGLHDDRRVTSRLAKLTFDEFRLLVSQICQADDRDTVRQLINNSQCTLERRVEGDREDPQQGGKLTWEDACRAQVERIRIPNVSA